MEYIVRMPKKLEKTLREMPENAKRTLFHHLAYSWVAVWRNQNGSYVVEVEYVGSREKSPY
jgi:hypothetical protein